MGQDLDSAAAAGANVVRIDIGWATLESNGPGQYTPWYAARLAAFMSLAQAHNLKVVAILFTTPCWASSAPAAVKQDCAGDWWSRGVGWYPPTNAQDYAAFARLIVSEYGQDLAAVEIWNEPDQVSSWNTLTPTLDYARMLKAAYPAAKQADPGVPVLAASLAGADLPFLASLYAQGIRGYYDGIAIHPYCEPRSPDDSSLDAPLRWQFKAGIAAVHTLQHLNGDNTPIWITEFGWNTVQNTAAEQAQYTTRGYQILAGLPYVQAALVYELRDDPGGSPSDPEANYGLLHADYTPKPAYAALEAALTAPVPAILPPPAPAAVTPPASGSVVPRAPKLLAPGAGTRSAAATVVRLAGNSGNTASVCVDRHPCASVPIGPGGIGSISVGPLSVGRHSVRLAQTNPTGVQSLWSSAVSWTVTAIAHAAGAGRRTGISASPGGGLQVRCFLTPAPTSSCSVVAYYRGRPVAHGSTRLTRGRRFSVLVPMRLNQRGRRLAAARRRQITLLTLVVRTGSGEAATLAVRTLI